MRALVFAILAPLCVLGCAPHDDGYVPQIRVEPNAAQRAFWLAHAVAGPRARAPVDADAAALVDDGNEADPVETEAGPRATETSGDAGASAAPSRGP